MQLAPMPFLGPRFAALVLSVAALTTSVGCGESDECSTNSDCPPGRICRLGLCALDPGGDVSGDVLPDIPLDCLVAGPDDLIMTEILADPPSGADVDGNGAASTSGDEFVEVVNVAARPVALTNVQIDVGGKRVGLGSICLNPYQARVLFGSGDLPQLTNSGGTVSLVVDGNVVQSHTYGDEGGRDSSLTLERQLDKTSAWVLHKDIAQTAYSAGTCANGNAFPDCDGGVVIPDGEVIGDGEIVPSCTTVPAAGDLVINEILADPGDLDANGDGVPSGTDDEFVEVVNVSSSVLSLDGVVFRDAGTKVLNLPPGLCLGPNQVLLIFGKYNGTGNFGDALAVHGNNLSLNNDADTVTLVDASSTVLAQATYSGNLANADQSIVRETDLSGSANFVRHSLAANAGGRRMSPGFCQTGSAFPDCSSIVEPPPTDTDTSETVDSDVLDTTEVSDTSETVDDVGPTCGPAPLENELVVNEIMANPGMIDWNEDGTGDNTQDEFVEIVSVAAGPVELEGVWISDLVGKKYTFGKLCIQPSEAVVVFGKGAKHFTAAGVVVIDTTSHSLDINNTTETISVRAADGTSLNSISVTSSSAGVSHGRLPDLASTIGAHPVLPSGQRASPGRCIGGELFPLCLGL